VKLTRQGVRDLNPPAYNGHRGGGCSHFFGGPFVVIGHVWKTDSLGGEVEVAVYGKRCVGCGEMREER
jgi:hypothetical protein